MCVYVCMTQVIYCRKTTKTTNKTNTKPTKFYIFKHEFVKIYAEVKVKLITLEKEKNL